MRFMIMHKNDPNTEAGQPPPLEIVHRMGAFIGEHGHRMLAAAVETAIVAQFARGGPVIGCEPPMSAKGMRTEDPRVGRYSGRTNASRCDGAKPARSKKPSKASSCGATIVSTRSILSAPRLTNSCDSSACPTPRCA